MEGAGEAGVCTDGRPGAGQHGLRQFGGGWATGGERDRPFAQFCLGRKQDCLVDQVGGEEGGVEVGAAFEHEAEDLALAEEVEDGA